MRVESVAQFFVQNHEYMPFCSTFTSLYKIFDLVIHKDVATIFKTFHCTSLKKNTFLRHIVLLNPFFGNVIIILYDLKKRSEFSFIQKTITADPLSLQYSREVQENERIVYEAFKIDLESFAFADLSIRNRSSFVSRLMEEEPSVFQLAGDDLRKNRSFILEKIQLYGSFILRYVSEDVLNDKTFMHGLMQRDVKALKYSKVLKNDEKFVLDEAKTNDEVLKVAGKKLKKDEGFVEKLIDVNLKLLSKVDESVMSSQSFMNKMIKKNKKALKFSSIRDNSLSIIRFIKSDLALFKYASDKIRMDENFFKLFDQEEFKIICYLKKELRQNLKFNLKCIHQYGLSLKWIDSALKQDVDSYATIVMAFIQSKRLNELQYMPKEMLENIGFAKACLLINTEVLGYFFYSSHYQELLTFTAEITPFDSLAVSWKSNREFCLRRIKENPQDILKMDESFREDRTFAYQAVKLNIQALKYFKFKSSKTFVLELMKELGVQVLQYASSSLKEDFFFVIDATKIAPSAVSFGLGTMRSRRDDSFYLLKHNIEIFPYLDKSLKEDMDYIFEYIEQDFDEKNQTFERIKSDRILENYNQILPFIDDQIKNSDAYKERLCRAFSPKW